MVLVIIYYHLNIYHYIPGFFRGYYLVYFSSCFKLIKIVCESLRDLLNLSMFYCTVSAHVTVNLLHALMMAQYVSGTFFGVKKKKYYEVISFRNRKYQYWNMSITFSTALSATYALWVSIAMLSLVWGEF